MAEFGMKKTASYGSMGPTQPAGGGGGGVEWFSAASTQQYANYAPQATYSTNYASSSQGFMGGGGNGSFEDEPPLLEELGIDLGGILAKTRAILLHRLNNHTIEDLDMGGALVFVFILGGLHLLTGKLHFGIILGWSVVHSSVLWFIVNQLAGIDAQEAKGLDLYSVCCLVGYCMAPIAVFSAVALLLPSGVVAGVLGLAATLWAGHTAAKIFARRCPSLEDAQGLVMLPCTLLYAAFTMLTLY
mmetsp:Transcript_22231/g.56527  ORF Transcript_22231/g.56527 Transcript_22231/m.56527 type:complete len:244 (-) Transcript_22231:196-927(-)|eukprot:CAMPEP_0202859636 /NCGR_PEP_ID=MMETSP1391-20130828/1663_1 /ASSEMBLY_ACC=CAM_ASM_000867 /TAXON_ID=1034604 /ORGANISM="Chlamydomonas leiostraca, Strain SAG 11-49" /LENGTH=243 /DNA_ID=CAMNT_0049538687 /DNA_START=30 /DNA_END=761 /DNA_ORIENTATION=+